MALALGHEPDADGRSSVPADRPCGTYTDTFSELGAASCVIGDSPTRPHGMRSKSGAWSWMCQVDPSLVDLDRATRPTGRSPRRGSPSCRLASEVTDEADLLLVGGLVFDPLPFETRAVLTELDCAPEHGRDVYADVDHATPRGRGADRHRTRRQVRQPRPSRTRAPRCFSRLPRWCATDDALLNRRRRRSA
jgi:hypothetical protein